MPEHAPIDGLDASPPGGLGRLRRLRRALDHGEIGEVAEMESVFRLHKGLGVVAAAHRMADRWSGCRARSLLPFDAGAAGSLGSMRRRPEQASPASTPPHRFAGKA